MGCHLDPSTPRQGAGKEQGGCDRVKALNSVLEGLGLGGTWSVCTRAENKDRIPNPDPGQDGVRVRDNRERKRERRSS